MAVKFEDYYATLGVARSASQEELKRAFRKLAREYHPDMNQAPGAEARFKQINEAYEVLKDPETRKRYDALGENWKAGQDFSPPPGWGGQGGATFNINDLFGGAFGGGGGPGMGGGADASEFFRMFMGGGMGTSPGMGAGPGRRRAPQPTQMTWRVTLAQLYRGQKLKISFRLAGQPHSYDVAIPPGSGDGSVIRLSGRGEGGADLLLKLQVEPSPSFEVVGQDLHTQVNVTPWEHALGAQVELSTPDEATVQLRVPAGVKLGAKMRLRGKGLIKDKSGARGDLLVSLRLQNPPALSDEQRALYEQLASLSDYNPRS